LKYFVNGYEGELTKDAIIAEATAAGFLGEPKTEDPPTPTEEVQAVNDGRTPATEEQAAINNIGDQVRSDTSQPGATPPETDPMKEGFTKMKERIAAGDRLEDASSEVIGRIIGEATGGNEKFLV
jgi:hypothetical protein